MKSKTQKSTGSKSNTYHTEIDGLSMNIETLEMKSVNVFAMFTSDEIGETLSLHDPLTMRTITVPFEMVEQLIKHTRDMKGKHNEHKH